MPTFRFFLLFTLVGVFHGLGESTDASIKKGTSDAVLVKRLFRIPPVFPGRHEPVGEPSDPTKGIQEFMSFMGVDWPAGSTVRLWQATGMLAVENTSSNLALIESVLAECRHVTYVVEIETQFVAFDRAAVEKLAIKKALSEESLVDLWADGKGKLMACPRVVTRSGTEASVRGVHELIYPTEFFSWKEDTNNVSPFSPIIPGSFETREEGSILSCIPEVSRDGTINLNLRPEWVELTGWEEYGAGLQETGKTAIASMRQPIFYRSALETQISVKSGQRILGGGGIPGRDDDTLIFLFITARITGTVPVGEPACEVVMPASVQPAKN